MKLDLYRLFRKPLCFVAMAGIHVIAESGMTTGGFMARARGIARIRRTPRSVIASTRSPQFCYLVRS